ncbi:MAG TPA: hypothetical protein VKV17_00230 [Bryobacteraceae bacterium]|nr:hypothetical protein [Bryobacteraceae bacterium]
MEGKQSPDADVDAIRQVALADVNRVAKQYLLDANSVAATLNPASSGKPVPSSGFGGAEQVTAALTKPVVLPAWAQGSLSVLTVPHAAIHPQETKLSSGMRLIVQTKTVTPTITIAGQIRQNADLETPPGQQGVSDVLDGLLLLRHHEPGPPGLPPAVTLRQGHPLALSPSGSARTALCRQSKGRRLARRGL